MILDLGFLSRLQKIDHGGRSFCRILLMRHMTEFGEDDKRAAGDVAMEAFGILGRNQMIPSAQRMSVGTFKPAIRPESVPKSIWAKR
jgi:hypothetical protein